MRARLVIGCLVAAFAVSAAPAPAAETPYKERWQRAARQAHMRATVVPGLLPGFVPARGSDGGEPIKGIFFSGEPEDPDCRRRTDRYSLGATSGNFERASDAALLFTNFTDEPEIRACESPRPPDGPGVTYLRRVEVLGARLRLFRSRYRGGPSYFVRGRIHGDVFFLLLAYGTDPGEAEIVRIAKRARWVRVLA